MMEIVPSQEETLRELELHLSLHVQALRNAMGVHNKKAAIGKEKSSRQT